MSIGRYPDPYVFKMFFYHCSIYILFRHVMGFTLITTSSFKLFSETKKKNKYNLFD